MFNMEADSANNDLSTILLDSDLVKQIFDSKASHEGNPMVPESWSEGISQQVTALLEGQSSSDGREEEILKLGKAALQAFLQATVTGPALFWNPAEVLLPDPILSRYGLSKSQIQVQLRGDLNRDGEAVYRLLPCVELFAFASRLLNHDLLKQTQELMRWRIRVNSWHQRLLNQISPSLQERIFEDLRALEGLTDSDFLIERAAIYSLHGLDSKAQVDLQKAAKQRDFDFALTGRLGKRTKYQVKELSQLVVLAKSAQVDGSKVGDLGSQDAEVPKSLVLNDDTLLEHISFSKTKAVLADITSDAGLPQSLATLDPSNQPPLHPLDCVILLAIASSITNTAPQDGLLREQTLPYADRVIACGSSNWQVYTEALHVRSRIEGHKTRTAERGVLQLQALVDQVIADVDTRNATSHSDTASAPVQGPSTFLPKTEASQSASAEARLQYVHHLGSPPVWKLEAELADRWVSLGAFRTALDIYERLELWAELALCLAATDQEDEARLIIRKQLYEKSPGKRPRDDELEQYVTELKNLPADAPRLFCILGDFEKSKSAYERAWEVSNHRYARAQRSIAKTHAAEGKLEAADEAYAKSLKLKPQDHASWFALGCLRLQLESWSAAIDAFSRAVQIDDSDAESWSNLAVAMLRIYEGLDPDVASEEKTKRLKESFLALKRAAALKYDSFRISQNLLAVAIKMEPPPYADIVIAQTRLIDLLGSIDGEKCVDVPIIEALVNDVLHMSEVPTSDENEDTATDTKQGLEKMVTELIQKKVVPLITSSRRLWIVSAKLSIHQRRPYAALTAYEKAWRSQLNQPSWDSTYASESKLRWHEVVESTVDLMDAYESLGERSRESGLAEGELVAKDWKFKARSAARSVLSRAKEAWEDDEAYKRLQQRLEDFRSG